MPHQLRRNLRRRVQRQRSQQRRRAYRNRRLRRNRFLNRVFGPPRRSILHQRGVPTYPLLDHLAPPIPPVISEGQFYSSIAHDTERQGWRNYHAWIAARERTGDVMEYEFRRQFSIPVHLPRPAMKRIFLFLAEEGSDDPFSGVDEWYITPEPSDFKWPVPFVWPFPWLD